MVDETRPQEVPETQSVDRSVEKPSPAARGRISQGLEGFYQRNDEIEQSRQQAQADDQALYAELRENEAAMQKKWETDGPPPDMEKTSAPAAGPQVMDAPAQDAGDVVQAQEPPAAQADEVQAAQETHSEAPDLPPQTGRQAAFGEAGSAERAETGPEKTEVQYFHPGGLERGG